MNNFLQQYGLNIVAVIVVLAFIVFASVFGDTITGGVKDITSDFFAKSGVTADVGNGNDDVAGDSGEEQQYQLSGSWEWNDELDVSTILEKNGFTENINFTTYSSNITCTAMIFSIQRDGPQLSYKVDDNSYFNYVWFYLDESGDGDYSHIWEDTTLKSVDFGSTPQEVSPEFYEWFTANATKQ